MNKLAKTLSLALLAVSISASAEIEWLGKEYNFGTWSEHDGLRHGQTLMINNTDSAILIRRVRPSCGCTGVDWPKDPIAPGDTAKIVFNYNPEGRPGPFEKTIKVFLNDSNKPEIISIKGTVIGTDSSLMSRYPYSCGPLRLSSLNYDFGDVTFGQMRHSFISLYNASGSDVTPALSRMSVADTKLPVEFSLTPTSVSAGDLQTLSLYLNTLGAEMGRSTAVQTICVGGDCVDITVAANVLPPASSLSPQELAVAPQCVVKNDLIELGKIKRGSKKRVEFTITNPGKQSLNIARVYSSRNNVKITGWPMQIEAGKSGRVKAEITTTDYPSDIFSEVIEIISDDPLKPILGVKVVGTLK